MGIILIILGSITWILTMFKSGLVYSFGMGFWGANGHDGIWHLAVIESLKKGVFSNPVFAEESIKNYHLGFDLLIALIGKITSIKASALYFQIAPIIFSILIGVLTYKFVYLWKKSKEASIWSVFFIYFGGSFGWIIDFIRNKHLGGESMFWSQQSISTLINPPFALSLIFILLGLIFLLKFLDENKIKQFLLSGIFFGFLVQIKAYAGVLLLSGLGIVALFKIVKNKDYKILKLLLFSLSISMLIFLPFNRKAASMFVFKPFWFLETMVGLSDRLNFPRLYNAIIATKGIFSLKAIISITLAFLIFIIGNFGTRLLGFLYLLKSKKDKKIEIFIILFVIGFLGIIIPQFFLQKGTPWNTIQFFYYSLFVFSIFSGVFLSEFSKKNRFRKFILVFIVGLTIPTTIGSLNYHYLPRRAPAKLSNYELEALDFLSKQEDGIVLSYPYDVKKAKDAETNPPRPLFLYESTAYVSAFSKHQVFLEDEVNLEITGFNWKERKEKILNFYQTLDQEEAKKFLKENKILFIYWVKPQRAILGESQLGLKRIFENQEVDIYQVVDNKIF